MSHMWVVLTEHLFNFFVRWYFLSREGGGFLPYCSKGGSVVPTQISLRSPTQRCFLQKGGKGRVLRNQLEISSLSDPHGSFLLSANNGGLTKHVRNTPGWKQDRLAESAPTSFGETKKAAVRAYQFLSVKQTFVFFTEFAHPRLSLYSSCWRVVFLFSLLFFSPSLKKLPHRLGFLILPHRPLRPTILK